MAEYANIIGRASVSGTQMPDQIINGVIEEMPHTSVMLSRARQVRMGTKKAKQAMLSTIPEACFVDGDTGLKQTSAPCALTEVVEWLCANAT